MTINLVMITNTFTTKIMEGVRKGGMKAREGGTRVTTHNFGITG